MQQFSIQVGAEVRFSKTLGETDLYLFSGITGDFDKVHVNEEYMKTTPFGRRIAHGLLVLGFSSTASSMMISKFSTADAPFTPVSLGYDRVRFVKPVYIGDTLTIIYTVADVDHEKRRSRSRVEMQNQHGDTVLVADHIMKWVAKDG